MGRPCVYWCKARAEATHWPDGTETYPQSLQKEHSANHTKVDNDK
jgi:hypothetical protein